MLPDKMPSEQAWMSLAEARIRRAQQNGDFDNLPGLGRPLESLDDPPDELWWVKEKLKREKLSLLPPSLAIRLDIEQTLTRIWTLATAAAVRQTVDALNERIRKANFAIGWGPPSTTMPLEPDEILAQWQERRSKPAAGR